MQFRHPELLWALLLLLIPILIHLFQLRRFKKTPFTNVAILQKVISNSRRSSTLKKWLLLFTRILLLSGIIIAFAQPFFANKDALKKKETTIYIDDSFSMQAKTGNTTLLQNAVQEIIHAIPEKNNFNLFTNTKEYRNSTLKNIQNELLSLNHTYKQLSFDEIKLKGETFFSKEHDTQKELIIISDFQDRITTIQEDTSAVIVNHLVQLSSEEIYNVSIDSVYIIEENSENIEIEVLISGTSQNTNIPVSLYNDEHLIAKTAVEFDENNKATVNFSIPHTNVVNGRIEVTDNGLVYDNKLYFNINKKEKIKVLVIGDTDSKFLSRIFTPQEFELTINPASAINFSIIESQHLIVLNEMLTIGSAIQNTLKSFKSNGGSILIIPSNKPDTKSYNSFLLGLANVSIDQVLNNEQKITNISFSNPLYKNVFEKKVTNFQYPSVKNYFKIKTSIPSILSFQDKSPFLVGSNGLYLFTASLNNENSNFINSPLIVPTFYNIGLKSLKTPLLYSQISGTSFVDISIQLSKDDIIKLKKDDFEFIPQQQSFSNKVSLQFTDNPKEDGIYSVSNNQQTYQNLSFNYKRDESNLTYLDISAFNNSSSITNLFEKLQKDSSITQLWKWFVILALIFLILEILIQKFFR